jgi:hypothetical protein
LVVSSENYTLFALTYMISNKVLISKSLQLALENGVIRDYQSFQEYYEVDFKIQHEVCVVPPPFNPEK